MKHEGLTLLNDFHKEQLLLNSNPEQQPVIISLRNVGLYFGRKRRFFKKTHYWALRDVSFDLHAGETLGVIGRNGVGKSTLLRVLAGIIAPNTGRIEIHRKDFRISLISLQAGFLPYLTGRQNAILNGMLLGATKREICARLEYIKVFSELDGFFDQPVDTYSTGMRARLGFSVAYFVDPDVILLDEVLGVGDVSFQQKSAEAMKQRIKSDKTVVLVSHSEHLLKELCDRLVWIENGVTQAQGNVSDVFEAYVNCMRKTKQAFINIE